MVRGRRVNTLVADVCPRTKDCCPSKNNSKPSTRKNTATASHNDKCIKQYYSIASLHQEKSDIKCCGYKRKVPLNARYDCPDIKVKPNCKDDDELSTVKDEENLSRVFVTSSPHRIELYSKKEGLQKIIPTDLKFSNGKKVKNKLKLDKRVNNPTAVDHKLTDYFPVRRSVRKTKQTILEEKQKEIEQLLEKGLEDGLMVHYFEGKGRGVLTTKAFNQGDFVVEYSGELLDITEAKQREVNYSKDCNTGCYMYYFKHQNQQYCVDATAETGRLGRLVNHSRNGNLITRTVVVNGLPRLVLIAKEYIRAGEEISYDYGDRSKESLKHHPCCETTLRKYTCPHCNADSCSLICYQSAKHLQCTESFYQKCVLEDMALFPNGSESKQKMIDSFHRLQEQGEFNVNGNENDTVLDSDDDAECVSLSDRLADVDLDDASQVWKKLTVDERQQFEAFVRSGNISKFVPMWQPWWLQQNVEQKIQDLAEATISNESCPKIKEDIKPFAAITKKIPSDSVQYNLINVICAYAFTVRYFNGCHFEFVEEAVNCVLSLSLTLNENKNFENASSAMESVPEECVKIEWIVTDMENINYMKEDTEAILRGRTTSTQKQYVLFALSDLYKLMNILLRKKGVKENLFLRHSNAHNLQKSKIKLCLRKIDYFLSYKMYYIDC